MTDPIENILQLVQQIGDAKIREELLKITGKIAESNSYLIFEIEKIYPDLNPDL